MNNKKPNIDIIKILINTNPKMLSEPNKQGVLPIHIALSFPRAYNMQIYELLLQCNTTTNTNSISNSTSNTDQNISINIDPYELLMTQDHFGHLPIHKAISNKKINN